MKARRNKEKKNKLHLWPHGIILALVFGVVTLSILAFMNPVTQGATATPLFSTPSATDSPESELLPVEQTQTEEVLPPPTPEEIGSTNGIIFWGTVLILILLIGTLRETLLRKGQ